MDGDGGGIYNNDDRNRRDRTRVMDDRLLLSYFNFIILPVVIVLVFVFAPMMNEDGGTLGFVFRSILYVFLSFC